MTHDYRTCPRCSRAAFAMTGVGSYVSLVAVTTIRPDSRHADVMLAAILLVVLAIVSLLTVTH